MSETPAIYQVMQDIHQQVREFVEQEIHCKVTDITCQAYSRYLAPLDQGIYNITGGIIDETQLILAELTMTFHVTLCVDHMPLVNSQCRVGVLNDGRLVMIG